MRCSPRLAALALAAVATSAAAAEPGFRAAGPDHRWSFPRDHAAHPGYRTEWWYLVGRLEAVGAPARRLGYQLTFFRVGLLPSRPAIDSPWATADLVMAHAAVSDLAAGRHLFSEVLWRAVPYLGGFPPSPDPTLAWAKAPAGTPGRWTLDHEGGAFRLAAEDRGRGLALRLTARPERPVVLQGTGGVSRKSAREGYASLYYSVTRLATEGTVTVGGETLRVRGRSWLDREFGSAQLAPSQVGWDWFALQLADGRDLMLYLLRRADGAVDLAKGTLVSPGGAARLLSGAELAVRATGRWTSAATGATYPAGWRVEVPSAGIDLEVAPALADQEDRSALVQGLSYWEGAVDVRGPGGAPAGEGYVELTGYGPGGRLPL